VFCEFVQLTLIVSISIYEGWKKTEKPIKLKNQKKKQSKKPNREKKPIKPIKILKKPTGSVGFGFISLKPKKPNRTEPK
jgi:hypothetical protein